MTNMINITIKRCLADMQHATAWLDFITAQANSDLRKYGEWSCDYCEQAGLFQKDYEKAGRELLVAMYNLTSGKIMSIDEVETLHHSLDPIIGNIGS